VTWRTRVPRTVSQCVIAPPRGRGYIHPMDEITQSHGATPAPIIPTATATAMGHPPDVTLVGYWCGTPADRSITSAGAPALTHPRDHVDPTMPLEDRERIAEALDSAPLVKRSQTPVVDLLDPGRKLASGGVSRRHLANGERSQAGYQWPAALSTYVRDYGLQLPAELLQALHVLDGAGVSNTPDSPEKPPAPEPPPKHPSPPVTLPPSPKSTQGPMNGPKEEAPDYQLIGVVAYVSTTPKVDSGLLPPRFVAWGTGQDGSFSLERMLRHIYVDVSPVTQAVLDGLAVSVPHRVESMMAGAMLGHLVS
jgi:hypothetical protein